MKQLNNKGRQGDVIIQKIGAMPMEQAENVGDVTVALGEVTGHAHKILPKEGATLRAYKEGNTTYVEVLGGEAVLYHGNESQIQRQIDDLPTFDHVKEDTHAPIVLPPAFYKFHIQREYDPQEYSRIVLD